MAAFAVSLFIVWLAKEGTEMGRRKGYPLSFSTEPEE